MCIVLAAVISWCGGEERFAVGSGREEGAWQGGEEEQEGTFLEESLKRREKYLK